MRYEAHLGGMEWPSALQQAECDPEAHDTPKPSGALSDAERR